MRICRFVDRDGRIIHGREHPDGSLTRLTGTVEEGFKDSGEPAEMVKRLAPLEPAAILCIGLNYRRHAEETGATLPEHPVLFMKNPAAVANPQDPIVLPACCQSPPEVDFEVELAVVLGRRALNVRAADALDYVLGYTIANDVSARRWQKSRSGGQWVRGKSFDSFCPLGPVIVTADEIPDPQVLDLSCRLNDETMQADNTAGMIFPVAELIERLSDGMTLLPGTVLLTGTPSGVGVARQPPRFLRDGDLLELAIEKIGVLRNPVRTAVITA